jgi:hypothetical protein
VLGPPPAEPAGNVPLEPEHPAAAVSVMMPAHVLITANAGPAVRAPGPPEPDAMIRFTVEC